MAVGAMCCTKYQVFTFLYNGTICRSCNLRVRRLIFQVLSRHDGDRQAQYQYQQDNTCPFQYFQKASHSRLVIISLKVFMRGCERDTIVYELVEVVGELWFSSTEDRRYFLWPSVPSPWLSVLPNRKGPTFVRPLLLC